MKSRQLKVSYRPTQSQVPLRMPSPMPFLRLQGRWLDQAGFAIGTAGGQARRLPILRIRRSRAEHRQDPQNQCHPYIRKCLKRGPLLSHCLCTFLSLKRDPKPRTFRRWVFRHRGMGTVLQSAGDSSVDGSG